ncbi:hypothetical protein TNCV_3718771 [Trichonephila clavipes]|nr:hypothetical protein TNCV_3718771 [Trichonephila clavipes]
MELRTTSHRLLGPHPYSAVSCQYQNVCRLFSLKLFFQKQQQNHEQAKELFPTYVVVRLMPSSDPVQMSLLCGNNG